MGALAEITMTRGAAEASPWCAAHARHGSEKCIVVGLGGLVRNELSIGDGAAAIRAVWASQTGVSIEGTTDSTTSFPRKSAELTGIPFESTRRNGGAGAPTSTSGPLSVCP